MKKIFDEKTKINLIAMIKNYSGQLSDNEIAEKCSVAPITVYRWKRALNSFKTNVQISEHYGVNYQKLCRAIRESEYNKNRRKYIPVRAVVEEPRYTWSEVVEIIYKKYNILLGD